MRFSPGVGRELREAAAELSPKGFHPAYKRVVAKGWFTAQDGAVLLRAFYKSYYGDRARFEYVEAYESAVNGRGIPDVDLPEAAAQRTPLLALRSLAFAWQALYTLRRQLPGTQVVGYVSVSPVLLEPEAMTGNVTFVTRRGTQPPYYDGMLQDARDVAIAVDSEECTRPLATRRS